MLSRPRHLAPILVLTLAVLCNIGLWTQTRDTQSRWGNVPPLPTKTGMMLSSLGDPEFAYRAMGIMLQNLGDTGGRSTNLSEYNYERLGQWLMRGYELNQTSNFLPFLAAYYFSANQNTDELEPIVRYLQKAGSAHDNEKWRWLAQAAFIARFKMNNQELALEIANEISRIKGQNLPIWARSMPAYVLNAQGEKDAAYKMLLSLIKTEGDKLHPAEVNATLHYVCTQILEPTDDKYARTCTEFMKKK